MELLAIYILARESATAEILSAADAVGKALNISTLVMSPKNLLSVGFRYTSCNPKENRKYPRTKPMSLQ